MKTFLIYSEMDFCSSFEIEAEDYQDAERIVLNEIDIKECHSEE